MFQPICPPAFFMDGFNKGHSLKFHVCFQVRQTPEEGRRTYQPKRCGNNNKMKTIVRKPVMIKIIKFRLRNSDNFFICVSYSLLGISKWTIHLINMDRLFSFCKPYLIFPIWGRDDEMRHGWSCVKNGGDHPLWNEITKIDWEQHWKIRWLEKLAHKLGFDKLLNWPRIEINIMFNGISPLMGYLMPKPSRQNSRRYY